MLNRSGEESHDPYVTLGVAADASQQDIARAYRRLAHTSHPDSHPDDPGASARFQAISGAYGILGDPELRAQYDRAHMTGGHTRHPALGDPSGQSPPRSVRVQVPPSLYARRLERTPLTPNPPLWAGPVQWKPAIPGGLNRTFGAVHVLAWLTGQVTRPFEDDLW